MLPLSDVDLRALQHELLAVHGPQGAWWPGEAAFEIAVGAILVQRSRWEQAAASIANLQVVGLLDAPALAAADADHVAQRVRPSGFPAAKGRRVQALARWVLARASDAAALQDAALRDELLGIEGVGEETADVIALYCFERPAFVCDEYARRVLRDRGVQVPSSYGAFRRRIAPALERAAFTVPELAELHGLIVEQGKARGR